MRARKEPGAVPAGRNPDRLNSLAIDRTLDKKARVNLLGDRHRRIVLSALVFVVRIIPGLTVFRTLDGEHIEIKGFLSGKEFDRAVKVREVAFIVPNALPEAVKPDD